MDSNGPIKLMYDNQHAIKLSNNLMFHEWTKHIAIEHHFIKEKIVDKDIKVVHVTSLSQLVDILTKPLGWTLFEKLKNELGMVHTIAYYSYRDFHIS